MLVISRSSAWLARLLIGLAVLGLLLISQHHVVERLDVEDDHEAEYDEGGNAGNKANLGSSPFLFLLARRMRERSAAALFFCGKRLIP